MYECPNCSANLKYNIRMRTLHCSHCSTTVSPYLFQEEQGAEEHTEYEVTVFTCSQCGGEIISEDTTAATFCSYCGTSAILNSRISKEKCPKYIIPFSQEEENCRAAYKKMMKLAFFAPDDLKDESHIKKFRGIYMPYWVYSFSKKGPISFKGSKEKRSGDYIVTTHFNINCDIDAEYNGIAYDASSTFCDTLSTAIAPFDINKGKPFTPAFLSGFYADTSDVDDSLYIIDAEQMAVNIQYEQLHKRFTGYDIRKPENASSLKSALQPDHYSADLALFPVWFLSYRKNNRVAYATVNGQTGKVVADLPVDIKKYLLGSLILMLPIFVLLNLFFTLKPNWLLTIVALLTMICTIISNRQMSRVIERENGDDDRGLQYIKWNTKRAASRTISSMMDYIPEPTESNEQHNEKVDRLAQMRQMQRGAAVVKHVAKSTTMQFVRVGLQVLLICTLPPIVFFITKIGLANDSTSQISVIFLIGYVYGGNALIRFATDALASRKSPGSPQSSGASDRYLGNWKQKLPSLIKPLLGLVVAIAILLINPVQDMVYYIGVIVCLCLMMWVFMDIIKRYNILSTHKLPQLNKRGGDEVE